MISIIIPCYQHNDLVKRAAYSAITQTYQDKEVIIVDDGSPEPVQDIWNGNVRVIRHEYNQGLSAALNTGIQQSRGDRFIILAADDELRSDCLAKLSQRDADVVCSDFQGDKGPPIKCRPADLDTLVQVGNCHSYAALIKRQAWGKTPGFRLEMNPSWEDYCAFIDLAKTGATWAYVPEPLHIYHRNPNGRDVDAQDKVRLLQGKLHGFHQDLFGQGKGVVTFVIPCYAQEQWLGAALASIKHQIYPHVNAVVVDDGSPGNVLKAVKDACAGEVHVVRQRNKHLSGARNTGIRYALENFNSEYLVMLDADDEVDPNFVEELMAFLPSDTREYAYCDIKFIGDAWHHYTLKDYDCSSLTKKHAHACTFLAPSQMYKDVGKRGYVYDESMKQGYEDWEFALEALHSGWCGLHYPRNLFHYRYHNGGSMRMEATEMNNELAAYIKSKHQWTNDRRAVDMACSTCGGRNAYTARIVNNKNGVSIMQVNIPGIGQMDGREPIAVTYSGSTSSIMTKIGTGGHIYKYSAEPHKQVDGRVIHRKFTAFARDAHLFVGPFQVQRLQVPQTELAVQTVKPQIIKAPEKVPSREPTEAERLGAKFEEREKKVSVAVLEPDNLEDINGVGPKFAETLVNAGFHYFSDVAEASVQEVALVLKISQSRAAEIVKAASDKL